jgi:hypothetical protein
LLDRFCLIHPQQMRIHIGHLCWLSTVVSE